MLPNLFTVRESGLEGSCWAMVAKPTGHAGLDDRGLLSGFETHKTLKYRNLSASVRLASLCDTPRAARVLRVCTAPRPEVRA